MHFKVNPLSPKSDQHQISKGRTSKLDLQYIFKNINFVILNLKLYICFVA